ncbi:MAG: hypothetical protein M9894_26585 [Planctomycetes bacterium]|nr:hypothetical protein [Planctomycetota bacterium]
MRRLLLVAVLLALPAAARAQTAIPPFPADRVAVAGTADAFDPLRAFLRDFRSAVGAEYHVCVVARSAPQPGPERSATAVEYVDRVWEAWVPQGLDPARGVVVLLALENRGVAVHPGSRWATLGFERGTITQVIDRSPFAQHARAGDHAGAVERLIQAIDLHLGLREADRAKTSQEAQRRLAEARDRLARARARVDGLPYEHGPAARELDRADAALRRAAAAQAAGDPAGAVAAAQEAVRRVEEALAEVDARERVRRDAPAALKGALAALARAEAEVAAAPVVGPGVAGRLAVARRDLDQAEQRLASDDPRGVDATIARAADQVAGAEAEQARALAAHRFRTRTVPALAAGALGLLALAALALARWHRGRRRAAAEAEVARWEAALGQAASRLLALADEHPLVFGAEAPLERWTGQTAGAFRAAAERHDDLFVAFAAARDALDHARGLAAKAGPVGWGAFDAALRALTSDEVEVGTEAVDAVAHGRLFLPDRRPVRRRAGALLGDLEGAYGQVKALMDDLERTVAEAPARLEAVSAALAAVEELLGALEARLLLPAHQEERGRLEAERARLHDLAPADPVGATPGVAALAEAVAALDARLARAGATLDGLDQALARLADDEARVAGLRRDDGLTLSEPGFEPEALGQATRDHADAARTALAAGDDDAAARAAARTDEVAKLLCALLEATLASRRDTPARLAAEVARREALEARLPERRARLDGLRAQHDDDALRPALDNAEEAQAALAQVAAALAEAGADLGPATQRYLAAAELVGRGAAVLDQVQALYDEVEHKAAALDRDRALAGQGLLAADGLLRTVQGLLAEGDRFASAPLRAGFAGVVARLAAERQAHGAARPHWPRLRDAAFAVSSLAGEVAARAGAEHAAWREVEALLPAVRARVDAQARDLARCDEDRAPANAELARARAALDEAARAAAVDGADWQAVLDLCRRADEGVEASRRLAAQDRALAQAAREAIARAHREQGSADRRLGHGVRVDLQGSAAALRRARDALAAHEYERALEAAVRAEGEAHDALRRAEAEARRRAWEEAQERERKERARRDRERREREARAAAVRRATTSSTSFSSRSSSSSGGSSFRSTSSGGSSVRGTSSGGSSW